jgi:hypothetical protein
MTIAQLNDYYHKLGEAAAQKYGFKIVQSVSQTPARKGITTTRIGDHAAEKIVSTTSAKSPESPHGNMMTSLAENIYGEKQQGGPDGMRQAAGNARVLYNKDI